MTTFDDFDTEFYDLQNLQDLDLDISHPISGFLPRPSNENAAEVLKVQNVNPRIAINGEKHHTSNFFLAKREADPCLIVRRGQVFHIEVTFNRPVVSADFLSITLTYYDTDKPRHGTETYNVLILEKDKTVKSTEWAAFIAETNGSTLVIGINPSAKSVVGRWQMDIDTKSNGQSVSYTLKTPIFILFNAWCAEDTVYMENEAQRKEYVLEDVGLIYKGVSTSIEPTMWRFGQYEKNILLCSLFIVQKIANVSVGEMANPVMIARALGTSIHSANGYGVLEGRWTPTFPNGFSPHIWLGSMEILQRFYASKQTVKYGQCWVFGGVLCTVARALGIPCRVVTNYNSAHDTEGSLTLDYYVNDQGKVMTDLTTDSFWNFHVWDELWMARPDLGGDPFNGWQVVDATPQEKSNNIYRCGPCPVNATKEGIINKLYDAKFVYSEVNADVVYWKHQGANQPLKFMGKDTVLIGKKVSTKAVGVNDREDVTLNYKYQEQSKEERDVTLKALQIRRTTRFFVSETFNQLKFDFRVRSDIMFGQIIPVQLTVTNTRSDKTFQVTIRLVLEAITYQGKSAGTAKSIRVFKQILASSSIDVELPVTYTDYAPVVTDNAAFRISCLCSIDGTEFEYFTQEEMRLDKPKLNFSGPENVQVGTNTEIEMSIKNPINRQFMGLFRVQGTGLDRQLTIKPTKEAEPGQDLKVSFQIKPTVKGKGTLLANFSGHELNGVQGSFNFTVY